MKRIKKIFSKLKLNQKFTLVILLLVMAPLFIFSSIIFKNMEDNAVQQLCTDTQGQARDTYNTLQKTVELCNMSTQTFLNDQGLQEFLERLKRGDEISTMEYLEFDRENIAMLERMVNSNPYLYQICVYAYNNDFPEMMPILYHQNRMESLPWAKDYESGSWQFNYPDSVQSNATMNASSHLMSLVSTMRDDSGEEIGVVEVAVAMDEIFPWVFDSDSENWACFVSDNGTVYQVGDGEAQEKWTSMADEILDHAEPENGQSVIHTQIAGENMVLAVQPVKELSGTYIQATSIQGRMDAIWRQENLLSVMLVGIFVLLSLIINALLKALLKKFYETLRVIREVQKGNLNVRVENNGQDEMGELGNQIDKMLDRIQELIRENIDREVLIKNTQVKALQNQINAHFIYNVLESVKMMAEIDEEYEISDAVTALGELLRYSMKWVSGNVLIRQEIEYIKNYIVLMNLRYDFTITLSVKIPEYIYEQEILKMSLQPIVENAIVHGIEEQDEDATIYIKVVEYGEYYDIEITDSGVGMNQVQLDLLYKKLSGEVEVSGGSGNGIGLKNVQDRIHMEFGERYGLHFAAKEGCYTKVSVRLPVTAKSGAKPVEVCEETY